MNNSYNYSPRDVPFSYSQNARQYQEMQQNNNKNKSRNVITSHELVNPPNTAEEIQVNSNEADDTTEVNMDNIGNNDEDDESGEKNYE